MKATTVADGKVTIDIARARRSNAYNLSAALELHQTCRKSIGAANDYSAARSASSVTRHMNLKHSFEIPADEETAWAVLLDIPRIAPCMPGAELTEVVDARTYKGLARVKVGPIALQFAGEAEIVEIDDAAHRAVVHAKGADGKGRGTANATVRFNLAKEAERTTRVDVETDLNLTGAVAQYGRASGLIDAVAKQIIADFVENLETELALPDKANVDTPGPGFNEAKVESSTENGSVEAKVTPPPSSTPVSGFRLLFKAIESGIVGWFKARDTSSMTGKKQ